MTAYMSAVIAGKRIEILSDGASYNAAGYVMRFSTKVQPIPGFPAAIATRGDVERGDSLKLRVAAAFEVAQTFDQAIRLIEGVLLKGRDEWQVPVQLAIWGLSETLGPVTYWFASRTVDRGEGAWILNRTRRDFVQGEACEWPDEYLASGTLADKAVYLMNSLRKEGRRPLFAGKEVHNHPIIGGHIDLTTITAEGVTQRRLHTWPDVIGERMALDPSLTHLPTRIAVEEGKAILARAMAKVSPASPGLSRQQRRALKASNKKLVA